jgi:signal transduction histidine kinase
MKRLASTRPALRARGWRSVHGNLQALSLATLVIVVFALGFLQYRWIDEVSEAQETRAKSRLREEVGLIADAFDAEVTRAVLVFTSPPVSGESMHDKLEQTWVAWNRDAPWPRVVAGVWFLEPKDSGWNTRAWGDAGALDPRSIPGAEAVVNPRPLGTNEGGAVYAEARKLTLIVDGQPSMLWPLPDLLGSPGSLRFNWILIRYDLSYLTDTFFPQLLKEYSTAQTRVDFLFQMVPRGHVVPGTVMVADQFHYRPDCLLPHTPNEPALSVGGFKETVGAGSAVTGFSVRAAVGPGASLRALLHAVARCQAPPSSSDPSLLQISVRRPQGTSSDVFTGFRRRNLFLSGLVLVVLVAALTALAVSSERARRLARLQTVVAAGISHELRTPLASLNVAVDHLKNGHVENVEQARKYGEIIETQAWRLRHIVDQALALTGLSQSNSGSNRQAVSVSEIVDAAGDGLAPKLREAGIELERHTAPDLPTILTDPDLLLRCLTNLIENSIKYAASGGWIRVSARAGQQAGRSVVELTVEDRGPGIQDHEASAVFEAFYRGSSARQSRQPGSGLGLAIVKRAVEAHGGWIRLDRAVPRGCKFSLFFPAINQEDAVHPAEFEVQSGAAASDTAD